MMRAWWLCLLVSILPCIVLVAACGDDDDDDDQADDDDVSDDDQADDDDDGDDDDDDLDDDDDDDDDVEEPEITILTMNLQNPFMNPGQVEERTQMVADLINETQPDFVAMQEVAETPIFKHRGEVLAELTGYELAWERTHEIPLVFTEGVGILSKGHIVWSDSQELPHPELFGLVNRVILGVRAEADYGEAQFFCSHMTTNSDEEEKADQALTAFGFIQDNPSDLPAFFAGDLNAEPDTLAMQFLRGEAEYEGTTGDLRDSWLEINPEDPGFTHPAKDPEKRIDYIYIVPTGETYAVIRSCERVLTEPEGGVWASDHVGVLCRYDLPE